MEDITTALSEQNQSTGIQDSTQEMLETNESIKSVEFPDYSNLSLKEITQIFQEMVERGDQQELYKNADAIKTAFFMVLKREKIANGLFDQQDVQSSGEMPVAAAAVESEALLEGESAMADDSNDRADSEEIESDTDIAFENPFKEIVRGFKELYSQYKLSRQNYLQEQERIKEENYTRKVAIIEKIKELLESTEDVNSTFPAFRELQNEWKSITLVPQAKAKDLWESYQLYVEKFYDYIKINNEFRDLDFKKNLELKTRLCEEAEALENEPNVVTAFKELQKLHDQWKELGPVAKEYRESIWERFKNITSTINKRHQSYFENLKEEQKNNLIEKVALCEKAEEIANRVIDNSSEWNEMSKQMEQLQAKWKTIGFASRKENQKIYDRFKDACDKFYNAKREYYSNFKNVMSENLQKKIALCEQAEALMNNDDWKKTTDTLINLQKQWKEVGPVARKQSDIVWKRFRAACDTFFDNKAKHFGEVDEKYDENLVAKLALIEEVKAFKISDSKEDNIQAMREFQSRWNAIGFVPFKEKGNIQNEWNKAMDIHFADIRSLASEKKLNKFKKMVADMKNSGKGDRGLRMEREKLIQKFRKMEQDIATLENNMGFFAKSKNADAMVADIRKKIEIAREELSQIEEKIRVVESQL